MYGGHASLAAWRNHGNWSYRGTGLRLPCNFLIRRLGGRAPHRYALMSCASYRHYSHRHGFHLALLRRYPRTGWCYRRHSTRSNSCRPARLLPYLGTCLGPIQSNYSATLSRRYHSFWSLLNGLGLCGHFCHSTANPYLSLYSASNKSARGHWNYIRCPDQIRVVLGGAPFAPPATTLPNHDHRHWPQSSDEKDTEKVVPPEPPVLVRPVPPPQLVPPHPLEVAQLLRQ